MDARLVTAGFIAVWLDDEIWDFALAGEYVQGMGEASDTFEILAMPNSHNVSSASYLSKSFAFTTQTSDPGGGDISSDGTKLYIVDDNTLDRAFQYTITGYDISTASYASLSYSFTEDSAVRDIKLSTDGTKLFMHGSSNDRIYQYSLATPGNVSTASYDSVFLSVTAQSGATGFCFGDAGSKIYLADNDGNTIKQYDLPTAWVLTSGTLANSLDVSAQTTSPCSVAINDIGTKLYVLSSADDTIYQYNLTTPFDISTASYASSSLSVNARDATPKGIILKFDGVDDYNLYYIGDTNNSIYQYDITQDFAGTGFAGANYGTAAN
jgi:hypothetical protein